MTAPKPTFSSFLQCVRRVLEPRGHDPRTRTRFRIYDLTRPIPFRHDLGARARLVPPYELVPFDPEPLKIPAVLGRIVDEVEPYAGTYGTGGYGFFALRLGTDWLVIAVFSASDWIFVDGKLARDWAPKIGEVLTAHLRGSTITSMIVDRASLEMRFSNGSVLVIDPGSGRRPVYRGSKRPREFTAEDDLRRAVFLAPTPALCL